VEPVPGWESDPFTPRLSNGSVVGCGAIDMKGGLVMILEALRALQEATGGRWEGRDIYVSITTDTHFGGNLGAGYIASQGLGRADCVIIGDTSGPDTILNGYRGQIWLQVQTFGVAAHGSTPAYGRNAVEAMADIVKSLQAHRLTLEEQLSSHRIIPESARRPSLSIGTTIQGGVCMNQVPSACSMTLDRRLIPEESIEEATAAIERVIAGAVSDSDIDIEVRSLFSAPPTVTDPNSDLVLLMRSSIERVRGRTAHVLVHPAFLDLQWFTTGWNIPGVVYGPGSGGAESAFRHKPYREPEESLLISDLADATKVLAIALPELAGHFA